MKIIIWSIVVVLALIVIIGATIAFGGFYDISAMHEEGKMRAWLFSTVMDNSVERRARGIEIPALGDSAQVAEGFEHFNEMCVTCHGAPGVQKSETGEGLNPKAPDLAKAALDWNDAELFWIIKNGVRMTGMPAFGPTHGDDKIWAIVAFVRKTEKMTPAEYQHFVRTYGGEMPMMESEEEGDHGDH